MHTRARTLFVALALIALAAACAGGNSGRSTAPATPSTARRDVASAATIAWTSLHNPVLTDAHHAVKDAALVALDGRWHAAFSYVDTNGRWRIGLTSSRDLRHWEPITLMPHDPVVEGEASPDVERMPTGGFVVTYQSFVHDRDGGLAKLYYRTTHDFVHFSAAHPLGRELHPGANERMIDAAVAWTPAGLLLGYKLGADEQHFEIARSTSGRLAGPWTLIGRPDIRVYGDTIENYQFLSVDGRWRVLATSNQFDRPFLFELAGDPTKPRGWLHWSPGRELQIPMESWNHGHGITGTTYEHANCAYLVDARKVDGWYYLLYSDSPTKSTFGVDGPAVLALARSPDLVHWTVPPSGG